MNWRYESHVEPDRGTLLKVEARGERPIVRIESAGPGHCYDTGNMIATALNRDAEAARLRKALQPFVLAYAAAADPIGDSDLDNEQPRHITVSLGDCRRAASLLGIYPKVRP